MSFLRDSHVAAAVWVHLLVTAAGAVLCCYFSIPAAVILCVCALAALAVHLLTYYKHAQKISALCDEIDRLLHGADRIALDSFQEGELSILATEIRKLTVRLREQNANLAAEKQLLKESLEDISHQLRTPLTSMMLILTLMRRPDRTKEQQREAMQELLTLLTRMQWLIETLLSLSRLEAGAVKLRRETLSCRALVRDALEPLSISMELKGIGISCDYDGEPQLSGDALYCTEALENILKNCMEHTPEGGQITVTAAENNIFTQIVITDSGSGISAEDLPHIFERFYRASEFAKNGYGIGLAFAHRIITEQGGTVAVRNARAGGAEFDIRFYKTVV